MHSEHPSPTDDSSHRSQDPLTTRWVRLRELHRAGVGAEDSWRWFVERYRPFVHDVLAQRLPSSRTIHAAEEEFWGYLFLSEAVRRADGARSFRPYLAGIVRNFARDWLRREQNGTSTTVDPEEVAEAITPDSLEAKSWVANVLALSLDALRAENERAADAITAFYGLGQSHDPVPVRAIAARLQCSVQAVYMVLHRGRLRLRELVEAELREGCSDREAVADELRLVVGVEARRHPGLILEDGQGKP